MGEERTRADSPNSEIGRTSEVAGVFGGRTWVRVRGEATRFQSRGRPLRQYVQSVVLHRCLQAIIMFGRRPVCAAAVLTLSLPLRACETACCFSCCRVVFVTSPARGSEQGSPLRRGSQSRGHFPGKGVGAGVASPARGSQQGSPPRRGVGAGVTSPARGSEQGSPLRRGVGAGVASPARGLERGSPLWREIGRAHV